MEKLKFEFIVKALQSDNKTNVITITSIENTKNEIFIMPNEFQNIALHEKLKNTATFQKVKATLTKRGNTRKVWISLDADTLKEYKDDDGNMHFKNYLLEEQQNVSETTVNGKYTINSEWSQWKKIFCDSFADKGWTPVRYAIEYKYINGCLLDYALKKERMLLEVNKSLGKQILIDLIAIGLPNYVCDKIDRKHLKDTEDLFNELRGLQHLVKKAVEKKEKVYQEKKSKIVEMKKPCKICKEEKRGERYHPESSCWFQKKDLVKTVNNSELEIELKEENPKN